MRFFILALCIHLILLALPLHIQKDIKATANQTKITIALQESNPVQESSALHKDIVEEVKNEEFVKEIKEEPVKEVNEKPVKEIKKEPVKKEIKKTPIKQTKKQNKPKNNHQQPKETTNTQGSDEKLSNHQNNSQNNTQTNEIFSINDSFCKKNVVFADIDNSYPKKAKMLKKNGTFDVVVRFSVNDKSIKIIDIKGDKLFVEHTKKLFKNLNYKINDKRAYECIFIKTIQFKQG